MPGRPCQGRPPDSAASSGEAGRPAASTDGALGRGALPPDTRIMALEHWEEVGQKGIKAVFTAHRGHKAPAGLATLSGLLPWDRPKVTG